MSVVRYRETVWSDVFPGNRHTVTCVQPGVQAAEIALDLAPAPSTTGFALDLAAQRRQRTVWRLDGGAGSDEQVRWLLDRGYHVLAKGFSNRRAHALARRVQRWDPYQDVWLGEVAPPVDYGRPVRVFVKRRLKQGKRCHSYYVSTLALPSKRAYIALYDDRGGAEIEQFRNDKSGLGLATRRKHDFWGQTAYILLTDLAHNLLADFHHRALAGSRFDGYGPKRIVRDLLATAGRLFFADGKLVRVELLSQKQFASDLVTCLEKYCSEGQEPPSYRS